MSAATYVGRTLARYSVGDRLGAGGMGEVFKAVDRVLQRPVALKILPHEVVANDERLRRFVREAQSASALNHPNIVTIYDVGECSIEGIPQPVHYIAMELIEGETLGRRIYGGCSLRTLVDVLQQVADALARAHAAGILHRDLKPDNIMVTTDGRAKIVDFGLAKLLDHEPISEETATARIEKTREGVVMGTIGYMSPEQANALPIDARSDIFSFGCVLFEAVTKRRPFSGSNTVDTLHRIVNAPHDDPTHLDPALPPALDRIVGRCLAKDPDERYQSMKEVAVELRLLSRELQAPSLTSAKKIAPRGAGAKRWPLVALGTALLIASAVAFLAMSRDVEPDFSSYRFTPLQTTPQYEGSPSYSPDGRTIAYVAESAGVLQVFARSLEAMNGVQLTHSIADCRTPFWDASGREIYYTSVAGDRDGLWAVGAAGGASRVVLENVSTAALSPDGKTIAFLRPQAGPDSPLQLWLGSPPPGASRVFSNASFAGRTFLAGALRFSPDGKSLGAWLTANTTGQPREFWLIDVASSKAERVLPSLSSRPNPFPFEWMPDNRRIVFSGVSGEDQTGGVHLWMADTKTDRYRALTASSGSELSPSVSPDGKAIVFAQEDLDFDLVRIPLSGPHVETLLSTARAERDPAWSPSSDGFSYVTNRNGTDEIWFRSAHGDFERPIATAKDFDDQSATAIIFGCTFSADGQRVAYCRRGRKSRIWVSPAAGGPALPVGPEIVEAQGNVGAPNWSPDASSLAFVDRVSGRMALETIALAPNSKPAVVLTGLSFPGYTHWSPDGKWLTATRTDGLYVVSPDGINKRRISEGNWLVHTWSPDSKAIYGVRTDDDLHLILCRLPIDGHEQVLADLGVSPPSTVPLDGFSLSPDGKTILAGLLKPKGDLWMLQGFQNDMPWWRRLVARK